MKDWAVKEGCDGTALVVVDTLLKGNIRSLLKVDPQNTVLLIRLQLEHSIKTYSGDAKTAPVSFDELTEFIIDQFPHIGPDEIGHAFRLAAAGKLGDVNLAAYYGSFSGAALGVVLNKYDDYRKNEVLTRLQEFGSKMEKEQARVTEEKRAGLDKEAREIRIEQLRDLQFPDLGNVFEKDFYWLIEAGLLSLSKVEYQEIYEESKKKFEEIIAMGRLSSSLFTREDAKAKKKILDGGDSEELRKEYQFLSRKIAVKRWVEKQQEVNFS